MDILLALLLSISSNLDNIMFGITYGVSNLKIPIKSAMIVSSITTTITGIFMLLGLAFGEIFNIQLANVIGGILLILIGICFIAVELLHTKTEKKNKGEFVSLKGIVLIATNLSINNIPIAIAGGMSNTNIFYTILFSFIFSSLFMHFGNVVGRRFKGTMVSIIASLLLIIFGIIKCV